MDWLQLLGILAVKLFIIYLIAWYLNWMNTRERIREKYQENKRNCLLKKIKFYEYLMGYSGTEKKFVPGVEIKNKTATLFFPTLNPLSSDQRTLEALPTKNESFTNDSSNQESQKSIWASREAKHTRTIKRQAFRITRRENIENISELITKSITPSARVYKKTTETSIPQKMSKTARIKEEWPIQVKSQEKERHCSPKKRTYVGTVHYIRQSKKQGATICYRKQSICPWEIENELLY